jgi:hypothetical protein
VGSYARRYYSGWQQRPFSATNPVIVVKGSSRELGLLSALFGKSKAYSLDFPGTGSDSETATISESITLRTLPAMARNNSRSCPRNRQNGWRKNGAPVEGIGLLIAVDAIPDIFAMAPNVTDDMVAVAVVSREYAVADKR